MSAVALLLALAVGAPPDACRPPLNLCRPHQCLRDCCRYQHWPYTRAYYQTWSEYDYRTEFDYPWYGRPHRLLTPYPADLDPACQPVTPTRIIERVPPPGVPLLGERPDGGEPRRVERPNGLRLMQ